jgi:hypothetical protein
VTLLTNLLPGLGTDYPNIRARICRAWRLKLCLRPSPFQPSRRHALPGLAAQKSAGTRVAGHSISGRPKPALRQVRLTTGSSPADPSRRASSAYRVRRPGVSSFRLRFSLAAEPERPRFPWPSLPLALRRGSVPGPSPQFQPSPCDSGQPALLARIFDGVIFRKPPPPVQVSLGPFRLCHPRGRASRSSRKPPGIPRRPSNKFVSRSSAGSLQVLPASACDRNRLLGFHYLRPDP